MRHVITGGCGFIGRYLMRALISRGERVVIFDLNSQSTVLPAQVDYVQGDIRQKSGLANLEFRPGDVVYHLAARQFHAGVPRFGRDRWFTEVNATGTAVLLEAMQARDVDQLVFFSTDMVYGVPNQSPVRPDHPMRPLGPYGRSKVAAERVLAQYAQRGMKIAIFRPRLVTGAGRYGILLKLFRLIKAGLPVPMIGSGENRYQMVSVNDCVEAALRAVDLGLPEGPFNLGSTAPPTVRELLEFMVEHAGSRSRVFATPARLVKGICAVLDGCGAPILYPEQFQIADQDYVT